MEHLKDENGIPFNLDAIVGQKDGGEGYGVAQLGRDTALAVSFDTKHKPVMCESTEEAIKFREAVYIRISKPGDKTWEVHREAREADKRRFPLQWAAFKNGQSQVIGLPIKAMVDRGLLSQSQYEMLKYAKVQTVQQLVAASQAIIEGFGPDGPQMQKLAKGFLNTFETTAKAGLDIKALKEELKKELLGEMQEQPNLDDAPLPEPKRRGRKKKITEPVALTDSEPMADSL